MKYKYITSILLFVFVVKASAFENEYYALIERAEEYVAEMNLDSALYQYDQAFEKFNTPFYKHLKQAAIISSYRGGVNKYLNRCVEKGMSRLELEYFKNSLNYNEVIKHFDQSRKVYAAQIDSALMKRFIEFDIVDMDVNLLDYAGKNYAHDSIHSIMIEEYIQLIIEFGFPTESKVGHGRLHFINENFNKCNYESCFTSEIKYLDHIKLESTGVRYSSLEDRGDRKPESTRPGNKFFWHYKGVKEKDSLLLLLLHKGVEDLQFAPENLVYYYEYRSAINKDDKFDMCCTYKSLIYTTIAKKHVNIYKLPRDVKDAINEDRKFLHIRSIDLAEKLFYALYKLETGKVAKKLNGKNIRKINYSYNSFMRHT